MVKERARIRIDSEFKSLISPLTDGEREQLESNLVADGCRDPLVIWKEKSLLLDGHNRYEICERKGINYKLKELSFASREDAADWMDANQLGRRNLTPDQRSLLLGRRYNRTKKAIPNPEGKNRKAVGDQIDPQLKTAERIAKQHGVSAPTIKRAGRMANAVDKIKKKLDDKIESKIATGTAPPARAIVKAAELLEKNPEQAAKVLRGEKTTAEVIRETKREEIKGKLEDTKAKAAKAAEGVYDVVVIDPPWPIEKIERDERPNQVEFDYPTMTLVSIASLKIPAAKDCHLWLWTTHKFLPYALPLLYRWGFAYVCTFVWHKPGGFQPIGLPQYNCEFALYARKGTATLLDTKALPVCFSAPRGKHSEKPSEFYDTVRRVTAGRRIDMFNRREIPGFDGWGNEAE